MSLLVNHFYRFGEFTLDPDQRALLRAGKPLALAPKVFDTLLVLIENSGRIVSKEELMKRLWPDTFVEEANLTYSIQQLRKSLGDDARNPVYIETIPRRGYRFIADVEEILTDRSLAGGLTTRRFETTDAQSPDATSTVSLPTGPQKPEPAVELANGGQSDSPEKSLDARPAAGAASTSSSKRMAAIAAAVVIALAGLGLVLWKFSDGSNKSSGENDGIDAGSSPLLHLKIEKLTAAGQSPQVAISPDGKYIAYTRFFEKKASIWLRHLSTNTNVEIVPATGPENINSLAFANSGEYLYFIKDIDSDQTALYRVSSLGGVPIRIADKIHSTISVSADDSQIAFVRHSINRDGQRVSSLITVNSDDGVERMLLRTAHPDSLSAPLWSPDGRSIICAYGYSQAGGQDMRLIEVSVADGVKKELSADRFFLIAKMAWLPNKNALIMSARKSFGDNNQFWRVSYPGMEIGKITEDLTDYLDLSISPGADRAVASQTTRLSDIWVGSSREPRNLRKITHAIDNFCWTPNGRIVYSSTASGNVDVWIMQMDGNGQRQLTIHPAADGTPVVTPDSRYIVFMSNRTGAFQVWRMNLDGSNQIQLTDGGGKNYPAISPDGKWVLYNTTDDWHLWKVSIDGGPPTQLTGYVAVCPSVSPDQKVIACSGRSEQKREILILPFEGGQPLKRIEFAGSPFKGLRMQWTTDGKALIYAVAHKGVTALIKHLLDGGLSEEIAALALNEDVLFDFGYSLDGQFLALTRGGWWHDIVLISNLNR